MTPEDNLQIAAASRRVAGIAALREIRRIVDAELADARVRAIWSRRFLVSFSVAGTMFVTWTLFRALTH